MSLSLFSSHSPCRSHEASLQSRISDLQAEVERLNERFDSLVEKAASREKELVDRILSLTNPGALHVLRSTAPAAAMPSVGGAGGAGGTAGQGIGTGGAVRARPSVLPGQGTILVPPRDGVGPRLTPEDAKFKPLPTLPLSD